MEVKPGYKQTEVGVIPEDWDVRLLPEVVEITNGKAHEQFVVEHGRYVVVNSKFISSDGKVRKYTNRNFCPAKRDSILVVMSDLPNGKALAKCFLVDADDCYAVNQRVCSFKAKKDHPAYLFYVLNRSAYFLQFDDGVQQTHLLNDVFRRCPVVLPSTVDEQRAIAEALSDMDALIGVLDRLIAKKRDLKQAAMQQLLTGQTRLPGFRAEWDVKRLGDVAEIVMGQSPSSSNYNTKGLGLPLIQGNADIANRKTIRRVFTTEITKRGKCGDILMSVRAPVGEISRAVFDVCLGRGVCAIHYANDFMYHFLISQEPRWARLSKGSTFDSVNSADVRALEVRLPNDTAEQTAIGEVLSDMDAELAALEQRRDKTLALKQAMMQELLTGRTRLI